MAQDRLSVVRLPLYGSGGTFSYTGTAGNSAALPLNTSGVWVYTTTDSYVRVGVNATATATDWPIFAYQMVWVPVDDDANGASRISAIQQVAGGSAFFMPGK